MSDLSSDSGSRIDDFSDTSSESEYELEDDAEATLELEFGSGEDDGETSQGQAFIHGVDRDRIEAYGDEPIANSEWLEKYREQKGKIDEEMTILQQRLDKVVATTTWYVFVKHAAILP